jgi:PPOX class probable F420-dependent enzyme
MLHIMPKIATADLVDRPQLLEFLSTRHHGVLITRRSSTDGVQVSPVACGVDTRGRIVIATYPQRAKVRNARRNPSVTICVLSDDWNDAYVQIDGTAEVLDLPDALDDFVEYYRCIAGEHPDWDEYRAAMVADRRVLMTMTVDKVYGADIG